MTHLIVVPRRTRTATWVTRPSVESERTEWERTTAAHVQSSSLLTDVNASTTDQFRRSPASVEYSIGERRSNVEAHVPRLRCTPPHGRESPCEILPHHVSEGNYARVSILLHTILRTSVRSKAQYIQVIGVRGKDSCARDMYTAATLSGLVLR